MAAEENSPAAFLDYLSVERGLSPHTIDAYRRDISQYISWLKV
ncbi:site-specific integrase, partial [Candidatus Aerophobetes bacterium]|nr:site-specific integrase [Candidatus Aerophobetes bacterium]